MSWRLLSIDPGTNHLGYTLMEIHGPGEITVLDIGTLDANKYSQRFEGIRATHGDRIAKLHGIELFLSEFMHRWGPSVVVSESPYLGRFPAAFAALIECMTAIRSAVIGFDRSIPLDTIDPASVKRSLGVSGKSGDKNLMLFALSGVVDFFSMHSRFVVEDLDEHARDSLAVGLSYLQDHGWVDLKLGTVK